MSKLLRKVKGKGNPSSIIFVDTETRPEPSTVYKDAVLHRFWFGHAIACRFEESQLVRRETIDFTDHMQFWLWASTKTSYKKPCWIMAHNAPFDLTTLHIWELIDRGFFLLTCPQGLSGKSGGRQSLFVADDPPTIIELYMKNGAKFIVVDTMNYWRSSLAKIGKDIGMPKIDMPATSDDITEWIPYCRNDTGILEKAVTNLMQWVESNGYGGLPFSAPALAMRAWRTKFMPGPLHLHQTPEIQKLERRSYYGGRLETFFIGKKTETIYNLDVCALYPYVMGKHLYPCEMIDYSQYSFRGHARVPRLDESCIATVTINSTAHRYPVKSKSGVIFPIGKYVTTLAGRELLHAVQHDCITQVHQYSRYILTDLFSGFVNHFWEQRKAHEAAGRDIEATFCKLVMNSLYGKFGQLQPSWEFAKEIQGQPLWGVDEIVDAATGQTTKCRYLGRRLEYACAHAEAPDHPNSFCAVASFVTANGRELMRQICEAAGWENVYYLVTDGILTNDSGYRRLAAQGWIGERIPGKLSTKQKESFLRISALHQYQVGDKVTRGAIKPNAVEVEPGLWRETHFEGLKSILAQRPREGVCMYPILKREPKRYSKGEVMSDGRVLPWYVSSLIHANSPSIEQLRGLSDVITDDASNEDIQEVLCWDDDALLDKSDVGLCQP